MEHKEELAAILHRIPNPAFLVCDGVITQANNAAATRQLCPGTKISDLLLTGHEEYNRFEDGCLYLTLRVCELPCGVSVTRSNHTDLFVIEQESDQAELQSMALAAQALRGPLSNVMTVADRLFPLSCFDDSQQAQDQIAHINRGLYQMLRIVCNMSDAYRYSTDARMHTELRDVGALMHEYFHTSAPLLESAGLRLHYTGPENAVFSLVDAQKLERAVGNILSNALKFSAKGGVIRASLTQKGKMLYLTVHDDGPGVPEHLRANLYSRYQRQPGIEESRFGIGLGMVLVRSTAAAHGGTVLIEHGAQFGMRLTMTIPIRLSGDTSVRSPIMLPDYAGERDHRLLELSDSLPAELYRRENIN